MSLLLDPSYTNSKDPSLPYDFSPSRRENDWTHTFHKGISAMWNADNIDQDLNSGRSVQFHTHRKGMHLNILPLAMGKIVDETGLFSLDMTTGLGEGKTLNSNQFNFAWQIDLLSHLIPVEVNAFIFHFRDTSHPSHSLGGCLRGLMVKAIDYGIVVSEFELQSRYYVQFLTNTLGKVWTPLSSQLWVK